MTMNLVIKSFAIAALSLAAHFASAQTAVVVRPAALPGPTVVAVTPAVPVAAAVAARPVARKKARRVTRRVARRTTRRVLRRTR